MTEETREQIKDISILVLLVVIATIFVFSIATYGKDEQSKYRYIDKIHADSLTIDSLKMKITHDSLIYADSLRMLHIKRLKKKDDGNKTQRDKDLALVKYATDKQLDSLWSVYSPKINH
jgi:hypothetical protein